MPAPPLDPWLKGPVSGVTLIWTMLKQSVAQTGCPTIARVAVVCPSSLVFNWQAEFGKWLGRERISTVPISAACKDVKREIEDFAFVLAESGLRSSFRPSVLPTDRSGRQPHCAWTCSAGGFDQRAYVRSIPAIKVFGDGP